MNNKAIPQTTTNSLYVAHSIKKESVKKVSTKEPSATPAAASATPVQPYHYTNKSYYYDSMGGGYQGL
ncbi:MAG TPA: hypothetical protein VD794_09745 [Flavisolibacter sp.]|nr:hypothetical protein [Flavisolibacter sp.]